MAEPVVNVASIQLRFEALEDLQSVPGASTPQLNNNGFNWDLAQYTPSTAVPVARSSFQQWTIGGGGTVDIDLTALPSSQSNIDGTGKKLQALLINNIAAGSVNVAPGASNAYSPFGASNDVDIPAGAKMAWLFSETLADISGSVKNIRITGTAGHVIEVGILLG